MKFNVLHALKQQNKIASTVLYHCDNRRPKNLCKEKSVFVTLGYGDALMGQLGRINNIFFLTYS